MGSRERIEQRREEQPLPQPELQIVPNERTPEKKPQPPQTEVLQRIRENPDFVPPQAGGLDDEQKDVEDTPTLH